MSNERIDIRVSGPNALASEYKRYDVGGRGDLRVSYISHETGAAGLNGVYGAGFTEELPRLVHSKASSAD